MSSRIAVAIANRKGELLRADDGIFPLYSLTKPYIASIVFSLGIDVREPIDRWFDVMMVPRAGDITVAQLLNHTSGLADYGALPAYRDAIRLGMPPWTDEEFADRTLRKPLLFEPGAGWAYSNPGYWLLSQIIQKASGLDFAALIGRYVVDVLGLSQTRVAQGIFADDLPGYPAGWVWHGFLMSSAVDVVTFMRSTLVQPLMETLVTVPGDYPLWNSPHNGFGLMVEPGVRFGHNGGGPGYSASCFHFIGSGSTGCVLMQSDDEEATMKHLLEAMDP